MRKRSIFVLSSFIMALGQPDRPLIFCVLALLFGLTGLFFLLMGEEKTSNRFWLAFAFGCVVEGYQLFWLKATYYHGQVMVFFYLFMVLLLALQFGLGFGFLGGPKRRGIGKGLMIASLWTLIEFSREFYVCGFPFNTIGLVLTGHVTLMQIATVLGVYGLTFFAVLIAYMGSLFYRERSYIALVGYLSVLLFPFVFGIAHIFYQESAGYLQKKIRVALFETALLSEEKWSFPNLKDVSLDFMTQWERIFTLLEKENPSFLDLIVLPENVVAGDAFDAYLPYEQVSKKFVKDISIEPELSSPLAEKNKEGAWLVTHAWVSQALANKYGCEVVVGLLAFDSEKEESYNAAFHFRPFKKMPERYDKQVLLPLSESLFLPFMKSFLERYEIDSFFTPGKASKVFQGKFPLTVSICYEEGFNEIVRQGRNLGAEILINISNDAWFPDSRLKNEHFNMGRVRAIENGAPLFRSCNRGISGAIDSLGRIRFTLSEFNDKNERRAAVKIAEMSFFSYKTPFMIFGNSLILFITTSFILLFGLMCFLKRSSILK